MDPCLLYKSCHPGGLHLSSCWELRNVVEKKISVEGGFIPSASRQQTEGKSIKSSAQIKSQVPNKWQILKAVIEIS
jgi:hypothetical protein